MQIPNTDVSNYGNAPGDGPLRVGGQPMPSVLGQKDLPSTPNAAVTRMAGPLKLCRDLEAGPQRIRDEAETYLPRSPGEDPANYSDRLARSVLYNAFGHTVKGMVGLIFRRDPVLNDDVPPVLAEHWENIDLAGTHGDVFSRSVEQDAIVAGHALILVEFPATGGAQTAKQDTGPEAPIRPYWVPVKKDAVKSWRTMNENGRLILTQLVLEEVSEVPVGVFIDGKQVRYRVFRRENGVVTYQLLEVTKSNEVVLVEEGSYPTQDEIPVVEVATSGARSMFDSDPPLLDLAYLNVAHYQQWSDYATSIHKTCVPIFVEIGAEPERDITGRIVDKTVTLGPNAGLILPIGGDAKYVSHDGQALGACKAALDDLKGDMATVGLAMLAPDKRVAETAEAKRIDKATSDSALAVTARALQDALERALQLHANYLRIPAGGSVTVNRDFDALAMDAQKITALSAMVQNGQLTVETLWTMLAEGNVLPDDFDADEELAKLAAEDQIRADAAAEAARQMQQGFQLGQQARTPPAPEPEAEAEPPEMKEAA